MSKQYKMLGKRAASVFLTLVLGLGCFPVSVSAQGVQFQGRQTAGGTGEGRMLQAGAGDVSGNVSEGDSVSTNNIELLKDMSNGVYALLGDVQSSSGLTMQSAGDGGNHDPVVAQVGDRKCWTMKSEGDLHFMHGNVDGSLLGGQSGKVVVEVTYWDSADGHFDIRYDAAGSDNKKAETVVFTGSNSWKTYTYHLPDAKFANFAGQGSSFRMGSWTEDRGHSSDPVYISRVAVKKEETELREEVSAVFTSPVTDNGISVRVGDGPDEAVKREQRAGKDCFTVDPETGVLFLYCNVDDTYLYGVEADIQITVEYLDSGTGKFALQYDAGNSSEGVTLEDSGEWKQHTFLLKNFTFANQMNDADFRIGLYAPNIGISSQPISFAGVKVKKLSTIAIKSDVVSKSGKVGHIFRNQEPFDLSIVLENLTAQESYVGVKYKVVNHNGNVLLENSAEQALGAEGTVSLPLDLSGVKDYGTFTLELEVSDGSGSENLVKSYPFSRILAADGRQTDMMGVGCHFAQGKGDPAKNLPVASQAGIQWVRDEMYWETAEKQKGVVEVLPEWDAWVNEAVSNGLKPVLILNYSNPLYEEGIGSREWLDGFTNYCRVLAEHFKGRIDTFEIWNEWNGGMGLPGKMPVSEYCRILLAASAAVREANQDAFIIGGATAGADITWLQQMMEYPGVYDAIDAVSMHPYTYPASPENGGLADSVKKLNQIFGDRPAKKIWLTEIGWPTHTSGTGVDEAMSGAYAVRMYTWALANQDQVDKIFWYDLQNDGMNPEINEDNFGLIRSWNASETVPWSAKSNYAAVSAFTSKLSGAEFRKQCDFGDGVYAYEFAEADGTKTIVMWGNGTAVNVTLNVGAGAVMLSDMFGNGQAVMPSNGLISVTAADLPVYLEGSFEQDVTAAEEGFVLNSMDYNVTAGAEFPVTIVRNGVFKELSGDYEVILPEGWKARNTRFLAGSAKDEILVAVPEGLTEGIFQITVKPVCEGQMLGSFLLKAAIVNQCSVEVNPVYGAENGQDQWKIRATVQNNASAAQLKGKIEFLEPAAWAGQHSSREFAIEGSGEAEFVFEVPGNPGQELYQVKMRITPEEGKPIVITKPVSFLGAMEAKKPVAVDGVLSEGEWNDSMSFELGENDFVTLGGEWTDITARGFVKWDKENLYLAVDVSDASHFQTGRGSDVWSGDSIQFCIDPGRKVKPGINGFNEIGFALNSEDGKVYHWKWSSAAGSSELADSRFMVKREGLKTTYEAAIPWKDLIPEGTEIEPGLNIGFSLLINNNDVSETGESGRTGFLEYMSGIGLNKDAELFGDLILVGAASEPDTPDPKPDTPDPKPDTPDPKPDTPDPKPDTPDPKPDTPDLKPDTPDPKPDIPDPVPAPDISDSGQHTEKAEPAGNGKTSPVTGDFSETPLAGEPNGGIPWGALVAAAIGGIAAAGYVWMKRKSDTPDKNE